MKRKSIDNVARLGLLVIALPWTVGCTGSFGGEKDRDDSDSGRMGDDDDDIPTPDELKLNRNPTHTLKCEDPSAVPQSLLLSLSARQYTNTIRDLIRPIELSETPILPVDTLRPGFAPNDAFASASADLIDGQNTSALAVGTLVADNLDKFGIEGCPPSNGGETACLDAFIDFFAPRVYRRPLTSEERDRIGNFAQDVRAEANFSETVATLVEGLVQTPQFLYRLENVDTGQGDGAVKLTGYEVASRLSYFIWGSMPDQDLFDAAKDGSLDTADGISDQVRRMLSDGRGDQMVKDFMDAWMGLDKYLPRSTPAAKDLQVFPDYNDATSKALIDGLYMSINDSLLGDRGGVHKLLTSDKGWVNDHSAAIFGVDAPGDGNTLHEVSLDSSRRKGLMTQPALMAGLASQRKQGPVLRGVLVMDRLLCQPSPAPPDDVDTELPELEPGVKLTTRQHLVQAHSGKGASCKACHESIDNIGFAFENYDAIGGWQNEEDGMAIDASSKITGTYDADGNFTGAVEMMEKLGASEQVAQCFVEHFYRYAMARDVEDEDGCNIAHLTDRALQPEDGFMALVEGLTRTSAFRNHSP